MSEQNTTLFVVVEQKLYYNDNNYSTITEADCLHKAYGTRREAQEQALKFVVELLKDKPVKEIEEFCGLGWYDDSDEITKVCKIIEDQPGITFKSLMSYLDSEYQIVLLEELGLINIIEIEVV